MFQLKLIQIYVILSVAILANSALVKQWKKYQRQIPSPWSDIIQANETESSLPAQYFLCGFNFKTQPWVVNLRNCCRRRGILRRRKCYHCPNTFHTMANGFQGVFCHYSDWKKQIIKTFQTSVSYQTPWRGGVFCPPGFYVNGVRGKYSQSHGVDLGFNGLLLRCSTISMDKEVYVDDHYPNQPAEFYIPSQVGNFISSYKIKYFEGGKLNGIQFGSQPIPVVSNVEITYEVFSNPNIPPNVLDSQTVTNYGSKKAQKKIIFKNSYELTNSWTLSNSYSQGYQISKQVRFGLPSFSSKSSFQYSYQHTRSNSFGNEIKTKVEAENEIIVEVPGCRQVRISSLIQRQQRSLPFTAVVTFVSGQKKEFLMKRNFTGMWYGVITSGVFTRIEQSALQNCTNLRDKD